MNDQSPPANAFHPDLLKLLHKRAVVGLSYFDHQDNLLSQKQIAGTVVRVTPEDGITLKLSDDKTEFTLPSDLSPWFVAPQGNYVDQETRQQIVNPDYLVTWNIYRTKAKDSEDKQHEWWEWVPCTEAPAVGKK